MEQLLTQIDSIKEKITDQEYRDMMDSLKTLHDEDEDENLKIEVVIAHIENKYKDVSCCDPRYEINKIVFRPKEFRERDTEDIKRYIRDTEEGGGIINYPIPLWVDFLNQTIRVERELPNSICQHSSDDVVAEYQEYTLLAVRKV